MALRLTLSETVALTMLSHEGFAVIWQLHLVAARAYREGDKLTAALVIEIADMTEREWLRRGNAPVVLGEWKP